MTDDEIIAQIIHSFSKFNLRDIEEINNNKLDFTIAEFILCSCFIDQLSGFRYNTTKVKKRYRKFIQNYLPNYNPDELYEDLRNKLVHNYSVGNYYGLTRNAPQIHLKEINGVKHLNLENFINDLKKAFELYVSQLSNDIEIRKKALCWYTSYKIITLNS